MHKPKYTVLGRETFKSFAYRFGIFFSLTVSLVSVSYWGGLWLASHKVLPPRAVETNLQSLPFVRIVDPVKLIFACHNAINRHSPQLLGWSLESIVCSSESRQLARDLDENFLGEATLAMSWRLNLERNRYFWGRLAERKLKGWPIAFVLEDSAWGVIPFEGKRISVPTLQKVPDQEEYREQVEAILGSGTKRLTLQQNAGQMILHFETTLSLEVLALRISGIQGFKLDVLERRHPLDHWTVEGSFVLSMP